jgi:3-oxoacid CoA-transferase
MNKVVASPEEAIADLEDGASVAFAGFGLLHRFPVSLMNALLAKGAKELTFVCNSLGAGNDARMQMVENRQVKKLVAAFSARPGSRSVAEELIDSGQLEVELVPQGILVERCRAAGAGIPAFYSPVSVGTPLAEGRETREFNGRKYLMEYALPVDYAFCRGWKADTEGNVVFRGGSQNFSPAFAKAARVAIVEVDEIVQPGELQPHEIDLQGIWVQRIVKATTQLDYKELNAARAPRRAADTAKQYNGKPALTREAIAKRAAALLPDGSYVNLGVGIPTLVSNYVTDRDVILHAENGVMKYGALVYGDDIDPDIYNAGGQFVNIRQGASYFDSVASFEMARGGALHAVILGAYQVDQEGNLANWTTPDQAGGGIGGAMDLVAGARTLMIVMEHRDSKDRPKLVRRCDYGLTGEQCVDIVVTDLALLIRRDGRFVLEEVAPGFTPQEVAALTDMEITIPDKVGVMTA